MKCYYENLGIIKDNVWDAEKTSQMLWPGARESIDDCKDEQSGLFDPTGMSVHVSSVIV